jgi:hypothetical protein
MVVSLNPKQNKMKKETIISSYIVTFTSGFQITFFAKNLKAANYLAEKYAQEYLKNKVISIVKN